MHRLIWFFAVHTENFVLLCSRSLHKYFETSGNIHSLINCCFVCFFFFFFVFFFFCFFFFYEKFYEKSACFVCLFDPQIIRHSVDSSLIFACESRETRGLSSDYRRENWSASLYWSPDYQRVICANGHKCVNKTDNSYTLLKAKHVRSTLTCSTCLSRIPHIVFDYVSPTDMMR